jgi:glutamine amidotransferase
LKVTLVDYGLGNILAFANIYRRLNIDVAIARDAGELAGAEKIVLPGVGAFDWAMSRLAASGMRACLDDLVLRRRRPVLGICVGMQMMAARSDEGALAGLGWFDAEVRRFPDRVGAHRVPLPHMGWNDVVDCGDVVFRDIEAPRFYFLHSYYFVPRDPACVLGTSYYYGEFASAVRKGNIYGVQFHPEKSHHWGVRLLKNFAEL